MRIISYVVFLGIILIGITFAALNSAPVTINYYLGTKSIALSLLLVFALGVGIILGLIFGLISWVKIKKENLHFKSRLKIVEQEVENLRSIPIKGE
jgi:lipopolysaccharide assembly protein A